MKNIGAVVLAVICAGCALGHRAQRRGFEGTGGLAIGLASYEGDSSSYGDVSSAGGPRFELFGGAGYRVGPLAIGAAAEVHTVELGGDRHSSHTYRCNGAGVAGQVAAHVHPTVAPYLGGGWSGCAGSSQHASVDVGPLLLLGTELRFRQGRRTYLWRPELRIQMDDAETYEGFVFTHVIALLH